MDSENLSIYCLPEEVISIILKNNSCQDILNFGLSCKQFNELVNNNQSLWKDKLKSIIPRDTYRVLETQVCNDWKSQVLEFHTLKKRIYSELNQMSAQNYWRYDVDNIENVRSFFNIALTNNLTFYFTVKVLQDTIKTGYKYLNKYHCEKPFTLTKMHYAKLALQHLMHTYLSVKWVKTLLEGSMSPELAVNFFLQWVDTENLHLEEDLEGKINELVGNARKLLNITDVEKTTECAVKELCAKGLLNDRKILAVVANVVFHQQKYLTVTSSANIDTLDIVKVLPNKCGNVIAVAAVYQAVAKKLGVQLELIAFPNHLFLEWRNPENPSQLYTVDLGTGHLHLKRRCPYSDHNTPSSQKYLPEGLVQYIFSAFHMTMGAIKNWQTKNASHFLNFLGAANNEANKPYRNYLPHILEHYQAPAMRSLPVNIRNLHPSHLALLRSLSYLNAPVEVLNRNVVVKKRDSKLKFAVGMICYHTQYDYVCLIRGWDLTCSLEWQSRMEAEPLKHGIQQPFYRVVATDQSERYVPQESLIVARPTRLYFLEDMIAREFTHFDGFVYVANDEKKIEYPDDSVVMEVYRNRFGLNTGVLASNWISW